MSIDAFAEAVDQDVETITAWEALRPAPRSEDLRDIATVFHVPIETLVERHPSDPMIVRRGGGVSTPQPWDDALAERWGADPYALWGEVEVAAPDGLQRLAYPIGAGAAALLDRTLNGRKQPPAISVRTRNNRLVIIPTSADMQVHLVPLASREPDQTPRWDGDGLAPEVYRGLLAWAARTAIFVGARGPHFAAAFTDARQNPAMRTRSSALKLLDMCRAYRRIGPTQAIRAIPYAVQTAARAFTAGVPVVLLLSHDEREELVINAGEHWLIDLPATDLRMENGWKVVRDHC